MTRTLEFTEAEAAELLDYLGDASNGMSDYGASLESFDALDAMEQKIRLFLYGAAGYTTVEKPRPETDQWLYDWSQWNVPHSTPLLTEIKKQKFTLSHDLLWGFSPTSGDQAE